MHRLTKKAAKKGDEKKKILKQKFQQLNEEKIKFDKELNAFMAQQRTQNSHVNKKVVYNNNSSKQLTEKQMHLLALGLNFTIASKKFPLI